MTSGRWLIRIKWAPACWPPRAAGKPAEPTHGETDEIGEGLTPCSPPLYRFSQIYWRFRINNWVALCLFFTIFFCLEMIYRKVRYAESESSAELYVAARLSSYGADKDHHQARFKNQGQDREEQRTDLATEPMLDLWLVSGYSATYDYQSVGNCGRIASMRQL